LKFNLDNNEYSILRNGSTYALFDRDEVLIKKFLSVTNELAPYFSGFFDFKIQLMNRQQVSAPLTPSYFFLPFYIDQDKGWSKNWNSFDNLAQFSNWRTHLVNYHTGIKPNEFYKLVAKKQEGINSLAENVAEIKINQNIIKKFKERFVETDFNIDIEAFKKEIDELLNICCELKRKEDELKLNLITFNNEKIVLESQINITKHTLHELKEDFNFATKNIPQETIDCPMCGAEYSNAFKERFSIAQDENRCYELLQQLEREKEEVNDKISKEKIKYNKNMKEITNIEEKLQVKKGQVKLKHLLQQEGKRELNNIVEDQLQEKYKQKGQQEQKVEELSKQLQEYNKSSRKTKIQKAYFEQMKSNLYKLDVKNLKEKDYKRIDANINESGSDLPRALLAYFYSILNIMKEFSSTPQCPVVIDTPNQQGQDNIRLPKMLEFIKDKKPNEAQLILAVGNLCDVSFEGKLVELKNELSLLQKKQYEDVSQELKGYLDATLL
ncbi:MAG: hypothetical protein KAI70_07420, partial [Candidatus Omnitrophica bacterium]|nr:hypothetical protein [Candidatus Omnitrophota bacterium]